MENKLVQNSRRIKGLDGLRGGILSVLFFTIFGRPELESLNKDI